MDLEKRGKMLTYFSAKTITSDIPENVLNNIRNTFSKFEIEYLPDGEVIVKVPEDEMEIVKKVKDDIYQILLAVKEENSVLAKKLARQYKV